MKESTSQAFTLKQKWPLSETSPPSASLFALPFAHSRNIWQGIFALGQVGDKPIRLSMRGLSRDKWQLEQTQKTKTREAIVFDQKEDSSIIGRDFLGSCWLFQSRQKQQILIESPRERKAHKSPCPLQPAALAFVSNVVQV
jgi:hypothetical protein